MTRIWVCGLMAASFVLVAGSAVAQSACETDLNGDGSTNEMDVQVLMSVVGSAEGDDAYRADADLDGDGLITISDYAALLACN